MKVLQINLNHCEAAQDLLSQTVREKVVDMVLVSEPYKHLDKAVWAKDIAGTAAIWTCGRLALDEAPLAANGFVRARCNGIYFYSCYAPPRWSHEEFQNMVDLLVVDARSRAPIIVAGDFNAWAVEFRESSWTCHEDVCWNLLYT